MGMEHWWNGTDRGKPAPTAISSPTDLICTGLGSYLALRNLKHEFLVKYIEIQFPLLSKHTDG